MARARRTGIALPRQSRARAYLLAIAALLCTARSYASLTVLVGEPFGPFGTMMPVGHTAIYLDHLCADGPLKLRECQPGEPAGVVVARYHRVGQTDWLASPVMEFLYGVERHEQALPYATPEAVWELRQAYRRSTLRALVPDGTEHDQVTDEWWESAGVAYNRRLWGYQVSTTHEQDLHFIDVMNADANRHRYKLRGRNCANFAADMVNLYFPGTVHQDKIADFGLMTPKQVARSLAAYAGTHPELDLQVLEIPQVPGTLRRSRPVRGGAEAGLKTKRYLFTLMAIQPEVPIGLTFLYLKHGRWDISKGAVPVGPDHFAHQEPAGTHPVTIAGQSAPPTTGSTRTTE